MSLRVFISYRREDTAGHAGRLHDSIASRLASTEVFMDVGGIEPGADFMTAIADAVLTCDVMLALIGTRWVSTETSDGQRRLEDPDDYVVAEIAAALERQVRVIPVLIDGARVPENAELPERLRGLERRNALVLDTVSWASDLEAMLGALQNLSAGKTGLNDEADPGERIGGKASATGDAALRASPHWTRRNMVAMIGVVAVAAVAIMIIVLGGGDTGGDGASQPLTVAPESAPGGSTVEVSGGPCPAVPEGKAPAGVYFGLHDPRASTSAEENPATGFAALRPHKPWTGKLDIPNGTSPGQYTVYAGCFAADPENPDRRAEEFFPFPAVPFEVLIS